MQVGFFFWPFDPDLVRRMAENAERWGYDMIGIADTPGNAMDPWVAATIPAQATSRVEIALCVTNLATRDPAVSAAAIASLDLIAPGRAILGIGTGHSGTHNLGVRRSGIDELETGARSIRALLHGETAGGAHLAWVRRPSRVFLAASGPKALAAAGRTADGAFVNFALAGPTWRNPRAPWPPRRLRSGAIRRRSRSGRSPRSIAPATATPRAGVLARSSPSWRPATCWERAISAGAGFPSLCTAR